VKRAPLEGGKLLSRENFGYEIFDKVYHMVHPLGPVSEKPFTALPRWHHFSRLLWLYKLLRANEWHLFIPDALFSLSALLTLIDTLILQPGKARYLISRSGEELALRSSLLHTIYDRHEQPAKITTQCHDRNKKDECTC
jgi:hypothetical protein